jgi:catechol 2,3-dioxygenase-like lactoylglutathione lyase family enzyme
MKIRLSSVMVDDQDKALAFYTNVLGFVKRTDIPAGAFRWLTVGSPDEQEKVELVLEPTAFPPARRYQKELFDAGIPATAFDAAMARQSAPRASVLRRPRRPFER